jgi:hypothetical protein
LFVRNDGKPWGDPNEWNRPIKDAAERCGLPSGRGACLYTFGRHSHLSAALKLKQTPVQVIAENVGTSQAMIERHYGKFTQEDRRAMIDAGTARLKIAPANVVKIA